MKDDSLKNHAFIKTPLSCRSIIEPSVARFWQLIQRWIKLPLNLNHLKQQLRCFYNLLR